MSFGDRLWDDDVFSAPEPVDGPHFVGILLERLNAARSPRTEQSESVRRWLSENDASPSLVQSIERAGL